MKKLITFCLIIGAAFSLQAQTIKMVKDINPSGDGGPYGLTAYNGRIYFGADDGWELWI